MNLDFRRGQWSSVAIATYVLLAFSFAFGGASRVHALRLALVELAALPLLVIAASSLWNDRIGSAHRFALILLTALVALPLFQLAPIPAGLWASLPGRQPLTMSLTLAGESARWLPLSLTPEQTWGAFLALLPPVAMFLSVLGASGGLRVRLVYFTLGATIVSIMIGLTQMALGSPWLYPWPTTTLGTMSGLFANRNHLATLLLLTLPFAATMVGESVGRSGFGRTKAWIGALFIGMAILSLVAVRSRAGILLSVPALGLSVFAAWRAAGRRQPGVAVLAGLALLVVAVVGIGIIGAAPLLERFGANAPPEGRFENWPTVAAAAQTYLPLGSGLGSFDAVYRSVEPLERLDSTFFNQAHNEYLETWLETGWLGIALAAAFIIWWARRSWSCWRAPASRDVNLQRAASAAILLILLHSCADYPLRVETITVLLALCSGILESAVRASEASSRRRVRRAV